MKRLKKTITLSICALTCLSCGAVGAMTIANSSAEVVNNGWGNGKNIDAVEDIGNGYTSIMGSNSGSIANETALDITKPIVVDFWVNGRVADDWSFIGVADTLALAQAANNEIYSDAGGSGNYPFIHMHNAGWIWHATEGNIATGGVQKITDRIFNDYLAYSDVPTSISNSKEYIQLEIYFGETADAGYFMINGLVVGKPSATQASFTEGDAFFFVNSWQANEWSIKLSQAETPKAVSGNKHLFVVSNIGGKLAKMDESMVKVTFDEETHNNGMMTTPANLCFEAELVDETYKLLNVQYCGMYQPAGGSWQPAYGSDCPQAVLGEDGKYTISNVNDWLAVVITMEVDPSIHLLRLEAEGVKAWIEDSVEQLGAGETAVLRVEPTSFAHEVKEVSYQIGNRERVVLDITENGEYEIVCPEDVQGGEHISVTVKGGLKAAIAPSEATVNNALNGWDSFSGTENYGVIISEGKMQLFEVGDGSTFMALTNSGSVSSVDALDVTKPIYMDFLVKSIGETEKGAANWVMLTLHDCFETGVKLGAQVYGTYGQPYYDIPALARGRFCFSFPDINDVTSGFASGLGDQYDGNTISQITNKFGDAWAYDEALKNYGVQSEMAKLEVYFGTTLEEGYIKLDGVKIGTPGAVQSDFENGVAYMHISTFHSAYIRTKLYQESSFDYSSQVSEKATVVVESDLSNVMAYDVIKFKVECQEGYAVKSVKANGVDLTVAQDGYYYYTCAFGGATLSVETGKKMQVHFVTNGGSSVSSMFTAVGAIINAPISERTGYTLSWCKDEALTQIIDFEQPLVTDENVQTVTIYAKWTPIKYSIVYYDNLNKIRDLGINSYTIEDSITLEKYEKEGYRFEGWYTNPQCTGDAVTEIKVGTTGEIVLYAKMTKAAEKKGCGSVSGIGTTLTLMALLGAVTFVKGKNKES